MARVHIRAWQVAYRGLIARDYLDSLEPEARARRYTFGLTEPRAPSTLVAVDNGTICGFATTGPCQDTELPELGELWAIYVDPKRWGTGVGRLLMAAAREQLRRGGYTAATLWVLRDNERARRFYEVDGWRPDGARRAEQIGNTTVNELRYRRSIVGVDAVKG